MAAEEFVEGGNLGVRTVKIIILPLDDLSLDGEGSFWTR
jgi:hypothetical protein